MPRGLGTPGTQTTCCSYIGTFSEYVVTNGRLANVCTVAWNPVIGPDVRETSHPKATKGAHGSPTYGEFVSQCRSEEQQEDDQLLCVLQHT